MDPANNSNLTTENVDPVPAYNPAPVITPPPPATPPTSPIPQAQVLSSGGGGGKPKVKWGKGVLVGSIFALVVLIAGATFFGPKLLQQKTNPPSKAAVDYCARSGSNTQCRDGVEWRHAWTSYSCPNCSVDAGCTEQGVTDTNTGTACGGGEGCTNGGGPCGSIACTDGTTFGSDPCYEPGSSQCDSRASNACSGHGGILVGGGTRHDITFTCDRCASDRRCQTPDIGVNPRYSTGAAPGSCAQVDSCELPGDSNCTVVSLCAESCSGILPPTPTPTPTPTAVPTPTPTPTPVPGSACQRIDILRNGIVITQSQVQIGDQIIFRGFASAVNTTVTAINFAVSQNGVITSYAGTGLQLVSGLWQANSPTITIVAASYSVTATPVYP